MNRQTVDHDGRTTEYWVGGSGGGRTVLYVHGSGCRHDVWVEQTGRDHESVAVNLSGHGGSEDVETAAGTATMDAYARDVQAVAREVEADVVVGHSLGGAVVQTLLLDHEYDPEAAVLANTGATLGVDGSIEAVLQGDIDPIIGFMVNHDILFTDSDHEHVPTATGIIEDVGIDLLRRDLMSCNVFDVRDRLEEIDVPTLCLVGESDKLTPPTLSNYLAENIPAAEYAEVSDSGHMAMLENPAAFNDRLDSFLRDAL